MGKSLPDRVAPWQLAHWGQQVRGQVPFAPMPRLAKVLLNTPGKAEVELVFGCGERGRCYVHGRIEACLQLICQGCLCPMEWPLDIQVRLVLVVTETGINGWPEDYEPWLVPWEDTASLWRLVEDEVLLALPIAARHPMDECPAGSELKRAAEKDKGNEGAAAKHGSNPFLALKKLKREQR